jgi:hypothetical protein
MKEQQTANKTPLGKKIKPRAVFQGDFRKHAFLKTYICPGNNNQEDENFEAFLDLVLRESDTIKGIEIIDTTELYEKYYNKTLPSFKSKYEVMIEKKLGKGEDATVQWKITSWSERTSTTAYSEASQRVVQDYKQNKYNLTAVFASTVKQYKKLYGEQAANNYRFEELAEFATQKGAVVFPGKLNGILKWGIKYYEIPVSFIGYKFKEMPMYTEDVSNSDDSDDAEAQLSKTSPTHGNRFFSPTNEKRKSPPLVYSSSPEDDETALLIETVGFYAVRAKERIKQQYKVDGYQAQLIFLQGYLDYCQRAGTVCQSIDGEKINAGKSASIIENSTLDSDILQHKM